MKHLLLFFALTGQKVVRLRCAICAKLIKSISNQSKRNAKEK